MAWASGPPGLSVADYTDLARAGNMTIIAPPDGDWARTWLSEPRLARYLRATDGDRARALALYEWNAQVGAALHRDLAHLEIALRNAYSRAIESRWTGTDHWTSRADQLFGPLVRTRHGHRVDVNARAREAVEMAVRRAGGRNAPSGKVVAELSFGFWRYLSSAAHEKTLWVPYLHRAFPAGTDRAPDVDGPVGRLHALRNRVAHHEPLINQDLSAAAADLQRFATRLLPPLADFLAASTALNDLLARRRP